ncbi:MAG: 8-oxo-dGTP diphosphatase [Oligoflexia bacterium]|nr:8-oxo-dGTP diphosphatase [Oligoflexia bacterium]
MQAMTDIDWTTWTPTMRATLLFVIHDGHALLIRKKRGLGAGKINAPGGKLDPGETAIQAAERELHEEVGVRAEGSKQRGDLSFQFVDGLRMHVTVFTAHSHHGSPIETDEAVPLWFPLDAMPYDEMWADDRVWIPQMIAGRRFALRALFAGDTMLGHDMDVW